MIQLLQIRLIRGAGHACMGIQALFALGFEPSQLEANAPRASVLGPSGIWKRSMSRCNQTNGIQETEIRPSLTRGIILGPLTAWASVGFGFCMVPSSRRRFSVTLDRRGRITIVLCSSSKLYELSNSNSNSNVSLVNKGFPRPRM